MGGALKRGDIMDVDIDADVEAQSSFDTRHLSTDFELSDYWDEGEVLEGKNRWPLCITLNTVRRKSYLLIVIIDYAAFQIPPSYHFIDATPPEEASTSLRLLLIFSFPDPGSDSTSPIIQGIRTLGAGELTPTQINDLITVSCLLSNRLHLYP
jgi:exosome complex component RRP42